jgi:hypothetical protein
MRGYILGLTLLGIGFQAQFCWAGITTLGPIPYLSKANSPFPVNGTDPNFYLEDFEDGLLNTPGISFGILGNLDPFNRPIVFPPGIVTDSVDTDDGVIDGNGQGGHALASGWTIDDLVFGYAFYMEFRFNQSELGFLPNAFGFVWTDGPAPGSVSMTVTTGSGASYQTPYWRELGDDSREGTTADDVFFGVIADEGIMRVRITGGASYDGLPSGKYMEIDHLQYGQLVPEPAALGQILLCIGIIMTMNSRRLANLRA